MGLWVSLGIVQKHEGSISVRSSTDESQHGTCFVVFLPATQARAQSSDMAEVEEGAVARIASRSSAAGSGSDLSVA